MAYPYPARTRITHGEVIVLEVSTAVSTAASGVKNHTINIPKGSYKIGISLASAALAAASTVKVYAFQTPQQDTGVAALSTVLGIRPHSGVAAATLLTCPSTSTYGGTSGQMYSGTTAGQEDFIFPYGLMVQVTANTSVGTYALQVICQG